MSIHSFEIILQRFGSETARSRFKALCREYYGERARMEAAEVAGESLTNSRRSVIHNEIMTIVQKLYLRSKEIMPSRKEVGILIMDHFRQEIE